MLPTLNQITADTYREELLREAREHARTRRITPPGSATRFTARLKTKAWRLAVVVLSMVAVATGAAACSVVGPHGMVAGQDYGAASQLLAGGPEQGARCVCLPNHLGAILSAAYVFFALDETYHPGLIVRPGQPINFVWEIYEFSHAGMPNPDWASGRASVTFMGNPVWPANMERSGRLEAASLPPEFYRAGSGASDLVLTVTKADGSDSRTARLSIEITLEPLDTSAFTWDSAIPSTVRWKQDTYTIGGTLHNPGAFTTLTFTPTLTETVEMPSDSTPPRDLGAPSGSATFAIPPGGTATFAWAPINQAWVPWFNRLLFIVTGPTFKLFDYTASFDVSDSYGNAYPVFASTTRSVGVEVEVWKQDDVDAANAAQVVAVAATVVAAELSWTVAGGLAAAAAAVTAESAAQILGTQALDPPTPDPNFTQLVALAEMPQQPTPPGEELGKFLELVRTAANLQGAISETYGKLLGALLAGDAKSASAQAEQFGALTGQIVQAAGQLSTLLDKAAVSVPTVDQSAVIALARSWQQTGVPKEASDALTKAGMDKDGLAGIAAFVAVPENSYRVADLAGSLAPLASAVGAVALAFRNEAPRVMGLLSRLHDGKAPTLDEISLIGSVQR
jgi:hypothetical protein